MGPCSTDETMGTGHAQLKTLIWRAEYVEKPRGSASHRLTGRCAGSASEGSALAGATAQQLREVLQMRGCTPRCVEHARAEDAYQTGSKQTPSDWVAPAALSWKQRLRTPSVLIQFRRIFKETASQVSTAVIKNCEYLPNKQQEKEAYAGGEVEHGPPHGPLVATKEV